MPPTTILITATTPHGVVLSRPWGIALDGLLASVLWHRRKTTAFEHGDHLTYHPGEPPEQLELPLARCGDPDQHHDWHWMATFADLHPHPHGTADPDIRWRRSRTNHQRLQQLSPTINKSAVADHTGRYQARALPVIAHPTTHLTWRAVGDADTITELLTELPAIGKHRNIGEGLVTQWNITRTPDVTPWTAGHCHQPGLLGRPTPARCLTNHPDTQTGPHIRTALRPPYLDPQTRCPAYQPAR
ncbi:hypothetical protein C0J29_31705 (plasmid) [Mycobacterium paragordonae]|uniref:Uncharacterized protein n=1 Tax=Mycobacterium paragordonae TaxID=1389713 RepID=A0ABQ1CFQ0_9MYCO|nr:MULTISPECIES: hypothetical protein [Mycobacterium]AYE99533.1 hypothetical protein C0J29_31705 [Mycobacterium paragordonae]QNI09772.1 hypothetical protein GAN17_25615 [Mycobacterium kubicae]GFG83254.1 hypothetical protein MPRG_65300 [Mycobacterium paragordonae]